MSDLRINQRRLDLFDGLLGRFPPGRVVDLGAGHGKFSLRAADAGWDVTAVDARSNRFADDDRITWVEQDVREFDLTGFDLILCLGLFYHLTLDDQLSLLGRVSGTPTIIDTHVATNHSTHQLSPPVEVKGYRGRMYAENGWENRNTASWQNEQSFWPRPKALYRMLEENGFTAVYAGVPYVTADRTFYLCLPG